MANYAVVTKVIVHNKKIDGDDSEVGSYAKKVSDYLESVDEDKDIRSIHSVEKSDGSMVTVIIPDSVA